MKFEYALECLRKGERIWRKLEPDKGSLCYKEEHILGSFCMTIFDIIANDWTNEPYFIDEDD